MTDADSHPEPQPPAQAEPPGSAGLDGQREEQRIADLTSRVDRVAAPLREQVLELLHQEIVEMRLLPGQRLVERELIERIGVSRTTIREALRQLAAEGLVTTIPQKGTIVAVPSAKDAAEVYEVRALLEGLIARQFAEKAPDEQVRKLREAFNAMEQSYREARDPKQLLRAKGALYEVLFEGADNATVRSILKGIQARVAVMRAATLAEPGRAQASLGEIREIVEAIEQRDAEAAARATTRHVEKAAQTLFSASEKFSNSDRDRREP